MRAIRAVAFDVDGTLYSEPLLYLRSIGFWLYNRSTIRYFRTIRASLHDLNFSPSYEDLYQWQIASFARVAKVSVDEAERRISRVIYRRWIERAARMPLLSGAHATLRVLQERGVPMAILSDFPPQTKLARWGISQFFTAVLNSELCNRLKPHRRPFELLANSLALPPRSILYVGNNPTYDINAAHRYGFSTAYYQDPLRRRHRHAASIPSSTFVFNRYLDLQRYLEQESGM